MIILSIVIPGLETHPVFRYVDNTTEIVEDITSSSKISFLQKTTAIPVLEITDGILTACFAVELFLRFISTPNKLCFMKKVINVIDIICVIPLLALFLLKQSKAYSFRSSAAVHLMYQVTILSILRLVRVFKLVRHVRGLKILYLAIKSSLRELVILISLVCIGVLVFSTLIFLAELHDEGDFSNIPIGYWWSVITITTVGYGDMYPQTIGGYIVAGSCAICGILITGLPIPIIASNFNYYYNYARLASRLKQRKQQHTGSNNKLLWSKPPPQVNISTPNSSQLRDPDDHEIHLLNVPDINRLLSSSGDSGIFNGMPFSGERRNSRHIYTGSRQSTSATSRKVHPVVNGRIDLNNFR